MSLMTATNRAWQSKSLGRPDHAEPAGLRLSFHLRPGHPALARRDGSDRHAEKILRAHAVDHRIPGFPGLGGYPGDLGLHRTSAIAFLTKASRQSISPQPQPSTEFWP